MTVRLGINTPVVVQVPGIAGEWEQTAGMAEIERIAMAADSLGFDHLTCSDHVAVAAASPSAMLGGRRGTMYWDSLATLSYLAARTESIRLCTNILVLGYHHPLAIAKRYGTLDAISGGRLILGVGVGSATEEFTALDVPFEDRGPRADDAMRALRASLSRRLPEYHGTYYDFAGLVVEPHAVQSRVQLWVGGWTARAARRALELGDGWLPATIPPTKLQDLLARHEVPANFEIAVNTVEVLDVVADPDHAENVVGELVDAGATVVIPTVRRDSLQTYLDQLHAVAELPSFMPTHRHSATAR